MFALGGMSLQRGHAASATPAPGGHCDARRPLGEGWDYAVLAILVVVVMVLIASGVMPIFDI